MKTSLTILSLLSTLATFAQIANSSFEDWTNLSVNPYENEMQTVHGIPNPMNGEPVNWEVYDPVGISQTTDAADGSYSMIIHNWYNYVSSEITYRGMVGDYPLSISGMYKYVTGNPDEYGIGRVIIKNTADDVVIDRSFDFGTDSLWTVFSVDLSSPILPILPADSIIITFKNVSGTAPSVSCVNGNMVCNLLFLDQLEIEFAASGLNLLVEDAFNVYPNPALDFIQVEAISQGMDSELRWEIIDLSGRVQLRGVMDQSLKKLNVSSLLPGTYFLRIFDQKTVLMLEKFLMQ